MAASSGWAVECRTCPTTIGGYGETIYTQSREFEFGEQRSFEDAKFSAMVWRAHHTDQYPGHDVVCCQYARGAFQFTDINREAMRDLFGLPDDPPQPQ